MDARIKDLARKTWSYVLGSLEQPSNLPLILWHGLARGAHTGELLKLSRHKKWLRAANIRTVIDVGAHSGEFASAARVILPSTRIYAFEPLDEPHDRLVQRFRNDPRFEAFNVALGNRRGRVDFWQSSFTKASSILRMSRGHKDAFPWSADITRTTVAMDSLDNVLEGKLMDPDVLLKIDVQGFEYNVLLGAESTLNHTKIIIVELSFQPLYEKQSSFHDVYRFLHDRGFNYVGCLDVLVSPSDESIMQEDAVFMKRGAGE